ncbi:MAG: penicillin-binding protein [Clostridia bacterium]|nr:penicillin-binding protein [Clostridia bacterium]
MTKLLKILTIIFLSLLAIFGTLIMTFTLITKDAVLDANKLTGAGQKVIIYDDNGNEVISASLDDKNKSVALGDLQPHTINAFIASEDRTFFSHNGLNYKRMIKAFFKNIAAGSFKEGASTISQQLIKNTHLSNDKTIKRKLKEIKLTKILESKYSKNEILEMYLNTIYFGHSCYGLQSAAQFYFDKKAENLNLEESATLVGLLTSPNNFSPFRNPEKSLSRRNTVLKSMKVCGFIDETTYKDAINTPLNAKKSVTDNKCGDYLNAVFDELEEIDFNHYAVTNGCIIKTYLKPDEQTFIENLDYPCDNSVIITNNVTGGVSAYKSSISGAKRQIGSTAKPIFVYAPALEEKQINTFTKILDEKIDYGGYSPENFDKKYHGYVTVADSLKYSYNVPAVKTLNALTIEKAEKYLTAMDIKLDDEEKNLSFALGGMKYGLSLQELADRYSVFPNGGNFRPSKFIKEIVSGDGKILYKHETIKNSVYSVGTCSLMNEMLIDTAKSGTAKKLKSLTFNVAAKTGTCGNSEGNTDAYTVCYTSENCIAVWLGDKNNNRTQITGGNQCCEIAKSALQMLYSEHTPENLDTTSGTSSVNIDREDYEESDKLILCDALCPKLNVLTVKVLAGNEPKEQSTKFSSPHIPTPTISVQNGTINIELCHAKYYSYIIKRINNSKIDEIYNGKWQNTITDSPAEGYYTYTVTPYFESSEGKFNGNEITLPPVNLTKDGQAPQIKIPDIAQKDWFNQ